MIKLQEEYMYSWETQIYTLFFLQKNVGKIALK